MVVVVVVVVVVAQVVVVVMVLMVLVMMLAKDASCRVLNLAHVLARSTLRQGITPRIGRCSAISLGKNVTSCGNVCLGKT